MAEKIFLDAQQLLEDSYRLAANIVKSSFRPDFIVALWRGGVPIAVAVQEFLRYCGVRADHVAIRTSSYTGVNTRAALVTVHGLEYLIAHCRAQHKLLLVDDVFDTGGTVDAVIEQLRRDMPGQLPHDIRIAVPYYKPLRNQTARVPDYYLHETDQWLMFPHSLEGLTGDEIERHRPELAKILALASDGPTPAIIADGCAEKG